MAKSKDQKESEQERALAGVAMQQLDDFEVRWRPQQARVAQQVVRSAAPGSFDRRRAETMAKADTTAAFSGARERLNTGAAATGQFGSARHKLGLTGMADDQAISSGTSAVAADQAADTGYVAGLNTVTALGRGEKATAIGGMQQAAQVGAAQARSDADRSFQNRAGNAQLAAQVGGLGAGLYMGREQTKPTYYEANAADLPDDIGDAHIARRGLTLSAAGGAR
jgi:hypothetical protein